jgi:hypothetical protein
MISIIDGEELKYVLRPTIFLRGQPCPADSPAPHEEHEDTKYVGDRRDDVRPSDRLTVEAS